VTVFDGKTERGSYEIVGQKDNCYTVQYRSNEQSRLCMIDGDMHLTVLPKSSNNPTEVFVRRS